MKPGVYVAKKKDGTTYYRSSVTYHNKHISLGSYVSEELAHRAYTEALSLLSEKQSVIQHSNRNTLPFEKWVILVNYRDNQVYIKNPIYLRNRYFEYYLDKNKVLKFDIEDLFYYSEHKISVRKGHLFVADYGMQVSIASRYGIKNYAVINKDYRFVNGDTSDFRYENIEIINHYAGVSHHIKHGKPYYQTIIHINGNFIIGRYKTEVEAAIAYNKAADFLKQNGINRNYPQNYIENLPPSAYADIYTKLVLPDKILNFRQPGSI